MFFKAILYWLCIKFQFQDVCFLCFLFSFTVANFGFASDFSEPSDQDKHKVIWYPRNQTWKHLMLFFFKFIWSSGWQSNQGIYRFRKRSCGIWFYLFFHSLWDFFFVYGVFFSIFGSFFHLSFSDCFQIWAKSSIALTSNKTL